MINLGSVLRIFHARENIKGTCAGTQPGNPVREHAYILQECVLNGPLERDNEHYSSNHEVDCFQTFLSLPCFYLNPQLNLTNSPALQSE